MQGSFIKCLNLLLNPYFATKAVYNLGEVLCLVFKQAACCLMKHPFLKSVVSIEH